MQRGPTPVALLAADLAVVGGTPLPFVRDPDGSVGRVAFGLRLIPRVAADA